MFYFYLTIKIIAYYSLPYYLFRHRKSHNKLLSFQSFFLLLWLLYLAYLSYLPFIDYYYTNELNVQFIIPNYASYILVVMFAPVPTLFYLFFIPLVSKFKILTGSPFVSEVHKSFPILSSFSEISEDAVLRIFPVDM